MADLCCAIVHWNTPGLLQECLDSLQRERAALRTRGLRVEICVVDNASRQESQPLLRDLSPDIRVIHNRENRGYRAANQAYRSTTAPRVLVCNPDVLFLPGSLAALIGELDDADVVAAGPRYWWDRGRRLQIFPSLVDNKQSIETQARVVAQGSQRAWLAARHRMMLDYWRDEGARDVPSLSGACLMVQRARLDSIGGLFDPRFFLYYEDSDLCERARQAGLRLRYAPQAEVIHLYNQSGCPNISEQMGRSRRAFLQKHYGEAETRRLLALDAVPLPVERPVDLGPLREPPCLRWNAPGPMLLAVGLNPQVVPAAAALGVQGSFAFTADLWQQMHPGTWFVRLASLPGQKLVRFWRFERLG